MRLELSEQVSLLLPLSLTFLSVAAPPPETSKSVPTSTFSGNFFVPPDGYPFFTNFIEDVDANGPDAGDPPLFQYLVDRSDPDEVEIRHTSRWDSLDEELNRMFLSDKNGSGQFQTAFRDYDAFDVDTNGSEDINFRQTARISQLDSNGAAILFDLNETITGSGPLQGFMEERDGSLEFLDDDGNGVYDAFRLQYPERFFLNPLEMTIDLVTVDMNSDGQADAVSFPFSTTILDFLQVSTDVTRPQQVFMPLANGKVRMDLDGDGLEDPDFVPFPSFAAPLAGTTAFFPVLADGNIFNAVALTNNSDQTIEADLEYLADQAPLSVSQLRVPMDSSFGGLQGIESHKIVLEPFHQTADLLTELFGEEISTPAWVRMTSASSDIASFFQFGKSDLTALDGGVLIAEQNKKFHFTRAFEGPASFRNQPARTRLTVLNPNAEGITVEFTYVPPGGAGAQGSISPVFRNIPAGAFVSETLTELFQATFSGGYVAVQVTEGTGAVGFQTVEILPAAVPAGTGLGEAVSVLGINAFSETSSGQLFSAQLASESGLLPVFTNVNLINTTGETRNVTLTPVKNDGSNLADPVDRALAAGEQLSADASDLFGVAVGSLQGAGRFEGSLKVDVDGPGVIGDVIFGDPETLDYLAALLLQIQPFTNAVFGQFASLPGVIFTGLAFFNPGSEDAELTVEITKPNSESIGEWTGTLKAGERTVGLVEQFVAGAEGQSEGFVTVTSDHSIIGQMLFGANGGPKGVKLFSAVPPTVISN